MLPPSNRSGYDYHMFSFLVTMLKENRKNYSEKQFLDAKRARKLYHIVGCPTIENFKAILRQNIIKNCPVTPADVDLAEKIFGPDIGMLKGKTTRRAPPHVKEDVVEVPRELKEKHCDLPLYMDIMFLNGMPLLTMVDGPVRYRVVVPLDSRTQDELYRGVDRVLQ